MDYSKIDWNNKQQVLATVKHDGIAIEYASDKLKKDHEVVLAAVKQNICAMRFVSDELKKDREFVLAAVSRNGEALGYAADEWKNDKEVVLAAVSQSLGKCSWALQYASDELKNDKEVVLAAVSQYGEALQYSSDELKNDKDVVLAAVKQNINASEHASDKLKNDPEVLAKTPTRTITIPDTPSMIDRLGYAVYAKALAKATRQAEGPFSSVCVGLYARWGGGKTTLWKLCKNYLWTETLREDVDILRKDRERLYKYDRYYQNLAEDATDPAAFRAGAATQKAINHQELDPAKDATTKAIERALQGMQSPYISQNERMQAKIQAERERRSREFYGASHERQQFTFLDRYIFQFIKLWKIKDNPITPSDVEEGIMDSLQDFYASRQTRQYERAALLILTSLVIVVPAVVVGCLGFVPNMSEYFLLSFILAVPALLVGSQVAVSYLHSSENKDEKHIKSIRALMSGNGSLGEGNIKRSICEDAVVILLHMLTSCISWVFALKQIMLAAKPSKNQCNFTPMGATNYVTVEFNAWAYSGSDLLWASLIKMLWDAVESKYGNQAVRMHRASIELAGESDFDSSSIEEKSVARKQALRIQHIKLVSSVVAFILVAVTLIVVWLTTWSKNESSERLLSESKFTSISFDQVRLWASIVALSLSLLQLLSKVREYFTKIWPFLRKARGDYILETASKSAERKDFNEKLGFMGEVKKEMEYLFDFLSTTTYKDEKIGCNRKLRLCVFIDDLDRCPEEIVVSVLEAVILLLVDGPITVWLAIDSRVVVECIEAVKKDVYRSAQISGHEFLDKIVQLPFCLPNLVEGQKIEYLNRIVDPSRFEPEQVRISLEETLKRLPKTDLGKYKRSLQEYEQWKGKNVSCEKSNTLLKLVYMCRSVEKTLGFGLQHDERASEVMDYIKETILREGSVASVSDDYIEEFCHGLSEFNSLIEQMTATRRVKSESIVGNDSKNINEAQDEDDSRTPHDEQPLLPTQDEDSTQITHLIPMFPEEIVEESTGEDHTQSIFPTLNEAEQEALRQYERFLDGNPRRLKRIMNSFNVCRAVYSQWTKDLDVEITTTKILKFVILLEQWPTRMAWIMQFVEDVEQNCSLRIEREQLKALQNDAEVALKQIRPTSDGLQDDTIVSKGNAFEMLKKLPAADIYERYVHGLLYSSGEAKKLLVLDSDPQLFVGLLDNEMGQIMGSDLTLPSREMTGNKKYSLLRSYAFNLPVSVATKVSRMIDELSVEPEGRYRRKSIFHHLQEQLA